jgi:2,5-diketo-D-gluconate reductase B
LEVQNKLYRIIVQVIISIKEKTDMETGYKTVRGVQVPALGLGTWDLRGKDCEKIVALALETGYSHIDTARMYGNEVPIGNAIKTAGIPRDQLFITTKVWQDDFVSKSRFFRSAEGSLKDLQLEQADLLLLHWPQDHAINIKATEYLLECYEKKLAKNIGVSNFSIDQLKQAQKQAPIFCNQFRYHVQENKQELLQYMQAQDLLITAYQPLSKGALKNDRELVGTGKKYNKSAVQIALRWLIQQPNVAAIPKASSREHLEANLEIFDFELSETEMNRLSVS